MVYSPTPAKLRLARYTTLYQHAAVNMAAERAQHGLRQALLSLEQIAAGPNIIANLGEEVSSAVDDSSRARFHSQVKSISPNEKNWYRWLASFCLLPLMRRISFETTGTDRPSSETLRRGTTTLRKTRNGVLVHLKPYQRGYYTVAFTPEMQDRLGEFLGENHIPREQYYAANYPEASWIPSRGGLYEQRMGLVDVRALANGFFPPSQAMKLSEHELKKEGFGYPHTCFTFERHFEPFYLVRLVYDNFEKLDLEFIPLCAAGGKSMSLDELHHRGFGGQRFWSVDIASPQDYKQALRQIKEELAKHVDLVG